MTLDDGQRLLAEGDREARLDAIAQGRTKRGAGVQRWH